MMNLRRSKPAGIADGTRGEANGSSRPASSCSELVEPGCTVNFSSSLADMAFLLAKRVTSALAIDRSGGAAGASA
jgi:hypothetical protein